MKGRISNERCARCGGPCGQRVGAVNRAKKLGYAVYCGRRCSGMARRSDFRTKAEKRADKRAYDEQYRERNREALKAKKAAYYQRIGPTIREKEREQRARNMPHHVEYCRRPEYRAKKHEYDIQKAAREGYGDYGEAWRLLLELEAEIRRRVPDKYERLRARGYYERVNEKNRAKRAERKANRD